MMKFNFIHINKSAGTSIKKALQLPRELMCGRKKHQTAMEVITENGWEQWNESFNFTFIRNPWDRVVSHYLHRVKTNQTDLGDSHLSFMDWVRLVYGEKDSRYYDKPKMFMPQSDWIEDEDGLVLVEFIGRFESLEKDFELICKKLGIKAELPHENATVRHGYREYYDEVTMDIVAHWFEKDINNFRYQF